MFRSIRRRIDNARQMQRIREEHPESIRSAVEEYKNAEAIKVRASQSQPAKSTPVIRIARWLLYGLTVLILLIMLVGAPRTEAPIFSLLSFGLLLLVLYTVVALIQPSIVFFRRLWSRPEALELFVFMSIPLIVLMVIFRP